MKTFLCVIEVTVCCFDHEFGDLFAVGAVSVADEVESFGEGECILIDVVFVSFDGGCIAFNFVVVVVVVVLFSFVVAFVFEFLKDFIEALLQPFFMLEIFFAAGGGVAGDGVADGGFDVLFLLLF